MGRTRADLRPVSRLAGALALLALLLPLSADQGEVLFLSDLRMEPGIGLVFFGQLTFGLAGLMVARSRTLGTTERAMIALGLLIAAVWSITAHSEATAQLLPHFPVPMQAGVGWLFLAAVMAQSACLCRRHPEQPLRSVSVFAWLAGLALAALYLWPHRGQTLAGTLARALIGLFDSGLSTQERASTASTLLIPQLSSLAVLWGIAVARWSRTARFEPWSLVTVPLLILALSAKAAASLSEDALVLVGLRAALLFLGGTLLAAHALFILVGAPPSAERLAASMRRWARSGPAKAIAASLAIASVASTIAGFAATESPRRPVLEAPPAWSVELFEQRLPELAIAVDRVRRGSSSEYLNTAIDRAVQTAAPAPTLRALIQRIGDALPTFDRHRRLLRFLTDALNLEAQRMGLPLYVDLEIQRVPSETGEWMLWLTTYRIDRIHHAQTGSKDYPAIWLTRLDHLNVGEQRLGFRKVRQSHAVVMLDVVRRHWHEDLAPALAVHARRRVHPLYRSLRELVVDDLVDAIDGHSSLDRSELRDLVESDLDCRARFPFALAPAAIDAITDPEASLAECMEIARRALPMVEVVLARRVETHEVKHLIDDRQLVPPSAVMNLPGRYEGVSIESVTAEVSAHLAEAVRSDQPRLALAHLFVLGDELGGVQAAAAHVVFEALSVDGESRTELLRETRSELQRRAGRAYRGLFDQPLEALSDTSGR